MNVRKDVAVGILIVMGAGMITNALAIWKNQAVIKNRVTTVEKTQEKQDNKVSDIETQVDQIHWYLIRSKNIPVPTEDK